MSPSKISDNIVEFSRCREPDWIDLLARELHVRIAAKLREHPSLIGIAVENLKHWKATATEEAKPVLRQWKLILFTWSPEEILEFLVADTAEGRRLRRLSPFCGVLTPTEIASIWQTASVATAGC